LKDRTINNSKFSVKKLHSSPALVRVAPFLIFAGLTLLQGKFGEASRYWIYLIKTGVGAWLVWTMRPLVPEMRWRCSAHALGVGIVVFIVWISLDDWIQWLGFKGSYPKLGGGSLPWNPLAHFGAGAVAAWGFVAVRLLGSALVVPPLEEVFFRSFLYRYLIKPDFQQVPLGQFSWLPFLLTSLVFGAEHAEWLAGTFCGLAYQGLVCYQKRVGDAIAAHAVTNLLLGLWVVWQGAWQFW
jgi:CAAX prenyl protease-like protein